MSTSQNCVPCTCVRVMEFREKQHLISGGYDPTQSALPIQSGFAYIMPHSGSNYITDIRSLRKLGSTLDHLFLASNPILDYSPISQIKISKKPQIAFVAE